MKNLSRRKLLQNIVLAGITVPIEFQARTLDFLANNNTNIALNGTQRFKLVQSVLDVLETYYKGMTLQFWELPFEKIAFEKRITNIVYWVNLATSQSQWQYAVDPVWVIAQIMAESLFCEFTVSKSMAAGICQIMPDTAVKEFKMVIAGSKKSHHQAPYQKPELAASLSRYKQLLKEKYAFSRKSKVKATFTLDKALQWLAEEKPGKQEALQQLQRIKTLRDYDKRIDSAKTDYLDFITTNIRVLGERDIFKHEEFFTGFDERFSYKKPIFAMVSMLSNALRVRSGNILAATAAYNAGLSRTWTNEVLYTKYGKFPNFDETSHYLSRIVANYEEISKRFSA
ncbi:MAG: transglycosylase SLT domain-containing protein [Gammaproteobacteria bacterium]|nr:transglycosylase SLT domain-containing protein [Gammaproteobacteria bacterium]